MEFSEYINHKIHNKSSDQNIVVILLIIGERMTVENGMDRNKLPNWHLKKINSLVIKIKAANNIYISYLN